MKSPSTSAGTYYIVRRRSDRVNGVGEVLNWDDESEAYSRSRGDRYRGGGGVEPDWAQQVMDDPDLAAFRTGPEVTDGRFSLHRLLRRRWQSACRHRLPRR